MKTRLHKADRPITQKFIPFLTKHIVNVVSSVTTDSHQLSDMKKYDLGDWHNQENVVDVSSNVR